jgi:hypothetical protein
VCPVLSLYMTVVCCVCEYEEQEMYFDLPSTIAQLGGNDVHIETLYGGRQLNKLGNHRMKVPLLSFCLCCKS